MSKTAINHIGFLTPGNYDDNNPYPGLEATLKLLVFGEELGFDSTWVRQRHLEHGISSAGIFLAAASQRTHRIQIGTAVIQIGYESPYRLAEDLSTVDVLSQGRLNVGVSAGAPAHADLLGPLVFDGDWKDYDLSHERVRRFANHLRGDFLGPEDTFIATPFGRQRPRLQPYAKGLIDRLWYGGGSLRSSKWAGQNGFNLMLSNVVVGEGTDNFFEAQFRQLDSFKTNAAHPHKQRVSLGRVIVPTDSADAKTKEKYLNYASSRHERTLKPQGDRRTLFPQDLVGTSEQILEHLFNDPVVAGVGELRLELPYEFKPHEYEQILSDFVAHIAPELGWKNTSKSNQHSTHLQRGQA
ncbi:LLM class flavin-dependent oxidoreductase [Phyllobacterium sp. YR531]|uniref:LLM class flavin-dependent oxidoreductase n=1 Tax=Phyllobacterium sp. YR531 TaxID=1144343 RepID=UPI00026FC3D2|nr:LLM class flavin-dependent oxidoreductase [Phyllobacterium sp. YR531]EJN02380.1 flavin-dependent oxidoreductase, methylene-tetrahydromethanopterin reductase [Phyllobacterium sp. YR531]